MPKYFIDFEFIEGFHKPLFGKRRHFIDMISVGICCDDGREYYAVSTDFSPEDANDWVKNNVIKKLPAKKIVVKHGMYEYATFRNEPNPIWKCQKEIIKDLLEFFMCEREDGNWYAPEGIEVYGYYSDFDWVLFASLFGRMIDLPRGFPMYCIDLKQILDEKVDSILFSSRLKFDVMGSTSRPNIPLKEKLEKVKAHPEFPKQLNEHDALADAKWNYELYKFMQTIKTV